MTIDVLILVLTLSVYCLALVAFALTGYFVWKTQHIEDMRIKARSTL